MPDYDVASVQSAAGSRNEARQLDDENLVRVVRELLRTINAAMEGLRELKVVSTRNSPVEGVAQLIACACLDLTPAVVGQKGFDATDAAGRRYEIKGIRTDTNSGQTSPVRKPFVFEYLVLVVLANDYRVRNIWNIPKDPLVADRNVFQSSSGDSYRVAYS